MTEYRTPLDDIRFTVHHIGALADVAALPAFAHADPELVDGLLSEAARFCDEVIAPTNRAGDEVGSVRNDDGTVTAAPGFADAYARYRDAGWSAVGSPPDYGGGGFPWLVNLAVQEMVTAANTSFGLCPMLTQGAIDALLNFGTEGQKERYLARMVSSEWSGTMNLTEPQAGSDVGALTTRAEPVGDGTWRIRGQKIFITWGEHDMADNIVHLVLARTPDSPPGTRGISLFIVPKLLVGDDGSLGDPNDVSCVSIEHKMGIHGSPTCVMSYGEGDGAIGELLGEEHGGMRAMFTMMNNARLSVGLEGVGLAERAYQQALAFAHERLQGRAPGAEKGSPSPIVDHPDVQRMLLEMRSLTTAARGLCYRNAAAIDLANHGGDDATRQRGEEMAALLTPLSKAWGTDMACEVTSLGIQVHGGMGYIEETGAAQHFRDARITPIYEGTNGIQAIDLVGRKVPMRGGAVVGEHLDAIRATVKAVEAVPELAGVARHLSAAVAATAEATQWLLDTGGEDPAARLPGATAYLEMLALTTAGEILAAGALAARDLGDDAAAERAVLARFFAADRVARVPGLLAAVTSLGPELAAGRSSVLAR